MVCDNDCFNCKYPDCILRDNEKTNIKQNLGIPAFSKEYYAAYRAKNKDRIAERYKKWYHDHKEEIQARRKAKREGLKA